MNAPTAMFFKRLLFALALGLLLAAPGSAAAEKAHYPMKPAEFRKVVEARIERVRAAIDKKLDHYAVSAERRKAIHKILDDAAVDVRAAATQAGADGAVTEAEADKVKALANELRSKVRERLRAEKRASKGDKSDKKPAGDKAAKAPKPAPAN